LGKDPDGNLTGKAATQIQASWVDLDKLDHWIAAANGRACLGLDWQAQQQHRDHGGDQQ
jgi:hypothetical protein